HRAEQQEYQNTRVTYRHEGLSANRTTETSNVYLGQQFDNQNFDAGDLKNDHCANVGSIPMSRQH
ncbi:hypothetical protein LSAT2_031676, partial [Lamellibrachia satsuma]